MPAPPPAAFERATGVIPTLIDPASPALGEAAAALAEAAATRAAAAPIALVAVAAAYVLWDRRR